MPSPLSALGLACLVAASACALDEPETVLGGAPDGGDEPLAEGPAADSLRETASIEVFLSQLGGVRWERLDLEVPGYDSYGLWFTQPIDHTSRETRSFEQRIILHHRSASAPTVLYTSGYSLFREAHLAELTVATGANQINVEQRFFGSSIPRDVEPEDWSQVTIEQAATDHHRIIEALREYYSATWLSTGHSKGGMTSVYHRRFFPEDVDATVAYVAPLSFGIGDERYEHFVQELGTPECHEALHSAQRLALERFDKLLPMAEEVAAGQSLQYSRSGGHAAAFEQAIANLAWSFWQYRGETACEAVPKSNIDDESLFDFVRTTGGIGVNDAVVAAIDTYYAQAQHELGLPSIATEHLGDLLSQEQPSLLPPGAPVPEFDAAAMQDIQEWLRHEESARILFVYGELDPWSAGRFDTSSCGECPSLTAAGGSHDALLYDLDGAQKETALDGIESWTGHRPVISEASVRRPPGQRPAPVMGVAAQGFAP